MNESAGDTLREDETALIADIAGRACPAHDFALRSTDDGIAWAVLAPRDPDQLRFTICRIDPCLIVLIEDAYERRQVRALGTMEDVVEFVCSFMETMPEAEAAQCVLH